jgi:hypothetical protein
MSFDALQEPRLDRYRQKVRGDIETARARAGDVGAPDA